MICDLWTVRETVLSIIGTPAAYGAIGFFIAGILTPRTPDHGELTRTG